MLGLKGGTTALEGFAECRCSSKRAGTPLIQMLGQQFPDALDAISGKLSDFAGDVATTWNEVGASIKSAADLIKAGFSPKAFARIRASTGKCQRIPHRLWIGHLRR